MLVEERLGVIASYEIPDSWRGDEHLDLGERQISVFRDATCDDILFCHMYRDVPLNRDAADKFQSILYAPFHELTDDEVAELEPVIEGLANRNAFKIRLADTEYLNMRRMIRIQGDWLEQGLSIMSCFVDNGGKGERVQNVYFAAPTGHLDKYEKLADKIFLSIRWVDSTPG
jgi:hypothetical protein